MKILELTNYTSGICGVWTRVREESIKLSEEGNQVYVFSSDKIKGKEGKANKTDNIGKIKIFRFAGTKLGGESYVKWYGKEADKLAREIKPDLIIAHAYRHWHTTSALKTAKKLGCKIFLVTHAPFVEGNTTRSLLAKLSVRFYDSFLGPSRKLKNFDKIINITKWEVPYLEKLGVSKEKLYYIPNGIPNDFFKNKRKIKEMKKIIFIGRIHPIKDLDVLIRAMKYVDIRINLEIIGPREEEYYQYLLKTIEENKLENRVKFLDPVYDINKKIEKIDSCKIFVLPSKREAMPQALIEAMARGKIVISSDNPGGREIVQDGKNGFLFKVGDEKDLAEKINVALKDSKVGKEAERSVRKFNWNNIIKDLNKLIKESV